MECCVHLQALNVIAQLPQAGAKPQVLPPASAAVSVATSLVEVWWDPASKVLYLGTPPYK